MKLGQVVKKWRLMSELDLREAAKQMHIGHTTLLRLENGKMPDAKTLITLIHWLLTTDEVPEPE